MPAPNRVKDVCHACGREVLPGDGTSVKLRDQWRTWCFLDRAKVESNDEVRFDVGELNGQRVVVIASAGFMSRGTFDRFVGASQSAGARWESDLRLRWCPVDDATAVSEELKAQGFAVKASRAVLDALREEASRASDDEAGARARVVAINERLAAKGKRLFRFQEEGAVFLSSADGACCFDDMGLGKTVQGLAAIREGGRAVVVAPKSIKGVWLAELATWRNDLKPTILEGRQSFRWPTGGEVIITGYPILPSVFPLGVPRDVLVIGDEAHAARNASSEFSKRLQALADAARSNRGRCILLTATAVDNRAMELWTLFSIAGVAHRAFGTFDEFCALFEGKQDAYGAWTFGRKGPDGKAMFVHAREIAERIRRVSIRRTKAEVFRDMPPKMSRDVWVPLDRGLAARCNAIDIEAVCGAIESLDESSQRGPMFDELAGVYKALSMAKLPAVLADVEALEEAGEPVIVFSPHRAPLDAFIDRPGWRVIRGGMSTEERMDAQRRFQAGELRGIAGTIAAMGEGLTLTRSANVLFINRAFVVGKNTQAEDRAYRLTQTRTVTITRYLADHPLERRITEILDAKAALIRASTGASELRDGARIASRAETLAAAAK